MGKPTDFNDLAQVAGSEAVKAVVDKALAGVVENQTTAAANRKPKSDTSLALDDSPLMPPQMRAEGFVSLLREICDAACESSEAHPVAVAFNVLVFFCAMVGRTAFQRIGDSVIHCRLFGIIIGKSGKARKGTAETLVRLLFSLVDTKVREELRTDSRLRVHAGGLSTGEGIAYAIRDAKEPDDKGKGGDVGVSDKRLLVIEAEFAGMLAHCRREGNTLSPTLRNVWDGRAIEPMTKTATTRASDPHVCHVGHITGHELREKATADDAANGLLNRYMMLFVYRPKLVPLPKPTRAASVEFLAKRLTAAVIAATRGNLHGNCEHEVRMSDEAAELWCGIYPRLTKDRDGRIGSLLARTEVYARMLAMVFALLDCRDEIEPCDLLAALAWVDYWSESASYVFRAGDGDDDQLSDFETEVYELIRKTPGIRLAEIQEHWHRNKIKPVRAALERLSNTAPPLIVGRKDEQTGGRAAMRYYPA